MELGLSTIFLISFVRFVLFIALLMTQEKTNRKSAKTEENYFPIFSSHFFNCSARCILFLFDSFFLDFFLNIFISHLMKALFSMLWNHVKNAIGNKAFQIIIMKQLHHQPLVESRYFYFGIQNSTTHKCSHRLNIIL